MIKNIVLLGVLALCASMTGCDSFSGSQQEPTKIKPPTGTRQRPQGVKALELKPSLAQFTQDDVTQYVRTHRLAKSVGDLSQLKVESMETLTAREVKTRLQNASTGLPDNTRLVFAIIRGPIYFSGPPGSKPVAFDRAYAVFDAATGNLLMSGTLEKAKRPTK